jgi:hypothetical protein
MQPSALHPFDPSLAVPFVEAVTGAATGPIPGIDPGWSSLVTRTARQGMERAREGLERGLHEVTAAFGQMAAAQHPSFAHEGLSLTSWEAQIDRGAGMLMRPPARLLIEAGLDPALGRRLAIRLDFTLGVMGGAYVPPRLVPQLATLLEHRFERLVKRLVAAEMDPLPYMSLLMETVTYANDRGLGIYETLGVIVPEAPESVPPGGQLVLYDRKRIDPDLRKRIETAAKPPKEAGKLARLLGRGKQTPIDDFPPRNGHIHVDQ